jgi:response regulator RpfG family c-di-GMP phosphodiesterase
MHGAGTQFQVSPEEHPSPSATRCTQREPVHTALCNYVSTYSMPKFLLTGYADKENAIKAINDVGLYQYVEKTWENQDLKLAIQQGLEKRVLLEMLEKRID